jgi:hypothetical protein
LNKKLIKISDLTKLNAAKLMMKIAGDSNHLKQYRNPNELSKHEIFDLFPLRPQGII